MAIKETPSNRALEPERKNFRSLLVANPNYFGNIIGSAFKPVKKFSGNTTYEQLMCVGLYPEFNTLEAVVHIKQSGGYNGGICSDGTPEYVRFYLSYDNGATWQDQGVTSFMAQDIPGLKPLEYAVQLAISPKKLFCSHENLPMVRAILSWDVVPPANMPNWIPVWGNTLDGHVQIDVFQFILKNPVVALQSEALVALLKENNMVAKTATMAEIQAMDLTELKHDISEGMGKMHDQTLSVKQLHELYKGQKIDAHRYLYPTVKGFAGKQAAQMFDAVTIGKDNLFSELGIDIAAAVAAIDKTDGNTSYEKMECVGLNTNNDNLEATIKVKLPYGFLGGLCTAGSREYVAFWMDFGMGWEYVGTTSVKTHDIASIPKDGLDYAVSLPVDLTAHRQPCDEGAKLAKVRAIMSWETAPPASNPNWVPTWGNREETLVLITPGQVVIPGTHPAFIETVGGMSTSDISNVTGLANGAAVTAGFSALDSPFAAEVVITGHVANPTDISNGATPLEYQVQVSNDGGGSWQVVSNSFTLHRTQLLGGLWTNLPVITEAAPSGWYQYQEDLTGGPTDAQIFVEGNILARWETNASMDGMWLVRIQSRVVGTVFPVWTSASVTVLLDNVAPTVSIDITSGGGNCADFNSGTIISGNYSALDDHFSSYEFQIVPSNGGTFTVNPSGGGSFSGGPSSFSRAYPTV
ncbi:MAG TPA: hypothetical protein VNG90_04675, partial [Candidatus Acidoferrum sp.]|nr:hypothetical protein [Candidatus Acidoferrum sp.]